ncbi:alpha/beta hydrolase [Williamsia maris]|uniref:Diacylglycerol O-acyltransferase / trehalose O-mycolyltransferase n=1 Tax=Williamsia maris TaxID=72806 RepID=A0ABT1HJI9_9NOCA|nr:alpha/beta hydrolase family protein [Williamsia maris]MCP2178093.1 diacylglycerol O-acyltransferase / trehalose O-mycolyltransferase [Williamsia maris]
MCTSSSRASSRVPDLARSQVSIGRRLLAVFLATATFAGLGIAVGSGGTASAAPRVQQITLQDSCGMPPVKVRMWTRPGNYKTVIALDGFRATDDVSGWEHNTKIQNMADSGVNVVEPVGGLASFYSDWDAPSNFNNQRYRYRWNCLISQKLIPELDRRQLNVGPRRQYAIMGISMGGNAAMVLGANNRRISHLFSLSGYLNLSAPGMREAIRIALLDAGIEAGVGPFNSDSMWGPPWSPRWLENDPFVQIGNMRGKKVRVAAGSGLPGRYPNTLVGYLQGGPLEALSLAQSRAFQVQALINNVAITSDFPSTGVHAWGYWSDMVLRAKSQGWFRD